MEENSLEDFDHATYKAALLTVLDMAREGHSFLVDSSLRLQVEVAKGYMWVSSIIAVVAMFVVKDVPPTPHAQWALVFSLVFTCFSFALSLLVLWGRDEGRHALIQPMKLATFVYQQCSKSKQPDTETITGLIATIHDSNAKNAAANEMRKKLLRGAAPLLFVSFLLLCTSIVLRLLHV